MAVGVTNYIATGDTTPASSTAGFTPAVGDLLVLCIGFVGFTTLPVITDNNAGKGGTWTVVASSKSVWGSSLNDTFIAVRDEFITSASNTNVAWSSIGSSTGACYWVQGLTGMGCAGYSTVRQAGHQDNGAASSTPTVVFGGPCLTTSAIVSCDVSSSNTGFTLPASATDMGHVSFITPTTGGDCSVRTSGFSGTSYAYGAIAPGAYGMSAVELDSTVGPHINPIPPVPLMKGAGGGSGGGPF